MKLIRNTAADGLGKYTVVNNLSGKTLDGHPGAEDEFFVIKLKDKHSQAALRAYADSVRDRDPEYAEQVDDLADRAGPSSPFCKDPD